MNLQLNDYKETFPKILENIDRYEAIIILRQINPSGDDLGAQFALKAFIKENWSGKQVYAPGDSSPVKRLNFMGTPDKISDLRLYGRAFVIILNTPKTSLIAAPWASVKNIIPFSARIDNHPIQEKITNIECNNDNAPATSQILGEFFAFTQKKLSSVVAERLYTGLLTRSYRMNYGIIDEKTYQLIDQWCRTGFSVEQINKNLYNLSSQELSLRSYLLRQIKTSPKKNVVYGYISKDILQKYSEFNPDTAAYYLIYSFVLSLQGRIWLLLVEGKDYVKGEIRSLNEYSVYQTAIKYGGQGTAWAASIKLTSANDIPKLITDLDNIV